MTHVALENFLFVQPWTCQWRINLAAQFCPVFIVARPITKNRSNTMALNLLALSLLALSLFALIYLP